ncbi:MAG: hypothetical protein MJZ81_11045 [Bacteroidales bacterium]|nr:hypothetical protein [Bacteroidales bacterium]
MEQNNIVLFQSQDGQVRLEVKQAGETVWLRKEMPPAALYIATVFF